MPQSEISALWTTLPMVALLSFLHYHLLLSRNVTHIGIL
jgi:hypothetical protein